MARIDDDLHARLRRRAQREGRSMNSIVAEALEAAVPPEDPRDLLRARAAAAGLLYTPPPPDGPVLSLDEVIALTRGLGTSASEALEADRDESWR